LADTKQSKKRIKQSEKNRKKNASALSMLRKKIKSVISAISNKNKENAFIAYKKMEKILDKFSRKGLIHCNKSARYKSRIFRKIKNL